MLRVVRMASECVRTQVRGEIIKGRTAATLTQWSGGRTVTSRFFSFFFFGKSFGLHYIENSRTRCFLYTTSLAKHQLLAAQVSKYVHSVCVSLLDGCFPPNGGEVYGVANLLGNANDDVGGLLFFFSF